MTVRAFRSKAVGKFQRRERVGDDALCEAISRAERGLVDADLGQGLIKQRVARPGQGRSGDFRTIIAYRTTTRAVFLYGTLSPTALKTNHVISWHNAVIGD